MQAMTDQEYAEALKRSPMLKMLHNAEVLSQPPSYKTMIQRWGVETYLRSSLEAVERTIDGLHNKLDRNERQHHTLLLAAEQLGLLDA